MEDDLCLSAATTLCENALNLADDHPDVLALQAYVAFFDGDIALSREIMDRSVSLSPQSSEIIAYQGALHDLIGDYQRAVDAYKEAIGLSPSAPAWIPANLGLSLLAMDENIEAEHVFKEVLEHYPDYARAWLGLTVALVKQGRMVEAQKAASSLVEFDRQFTVQSWARSMPFNDEVMMAQFRTDLHAAGLN